MNRGSHVYGWIVGTVVVASLAAWASPVAAAHRRDCAHHHRGRCLKAGKHSKGKRSYKPAIHLESLNFHLLQPVGNKGTATVRFQTLGAARVRATVPAGRKRVQMKYRLKSVTLADMPVSCETYPAAVVTQTMLRSITIPINEVEKVSWLTPRWETQGVFPGPPSGLSGYDPNAQSRLFKKIIEPVPGYIGGYLILEGMAISKRARALYIAVEAQLAPDENTFCGIQAGTYLGTQTTLYHLPL
jgi:hypothetical protein